MLLPGHLRPSDTCSPTILAPRIVEGVGASLTEGEGVNEGEDVGVGEGETKSEFRFGLALDLGLGSKCRWGATVAGASVLGASFMEPFSFLS
jgi:hypothetical protein